MSQAEVMIAEKMLESLAGGCGKGEILLTSISPGAVWAGRQQFYSETSDVSLFYQL